MLKSVVVDFNPIAIGVFEINLFDTIGSVLRLFGSLRPVAIRNIQRIEVFHKSFDGDNAKSEVDVDVVIGNLLGTLHHVNLAVLASPQPYVLVVMKRLGYYRQLQYFFVKIGTALQLGNINGSVV